MEGTCDRSGKFNDRLMRDSNGVVSDAATQQIGRRSLLLGKSRVESIDQDVCINQ